MNMIRKNTTWRNTEQAPRIRSGDLRIMSRQPGDDSKGFQQDSSVVSGKLLQNPQPPRNQEQAIPPTNQAKDEGHAPATGDSPPPLPLSGPGPRNSEVKRCNVSTRSETVSDAGHVP